MPTATAKGKTFQFPEGTTPEQMGVAIDEYFAKDKSSEWYQPARSALQGMTFGFSDEIGAGLAAGAASLFDGANFKDAYKDIHGNLAQERNQYREDNPLQANALELAGGLLSGGSGLARALPKATSAVGKALTGATVGGVEGGLYGAGAADPGNRMRDAAAGFGMGAATGGLLGGGIGQAQKVMGKRANQVARMNQGLGDKDLAPYKVSDTGGRIADDAARAAQKQGFEPGLIQMIKTAKPADREKILDMVEVGKNSLLDQRYAANNRVNRVVGESLAARVNELNRVNRQAAGQLEDVANSLKGKPVDYSSAIDGFISDLDRMGVGVNTDGNVSVDLTGSLIEGADEAKVILKRILGKLVNQGANDAFDVHRMKRLIDEQVVYGKGKDSGLKGQILGVIKRLRRNLDNTLDSNFPEYNRVNTQYSDTRNALDSLQDAWGGKVDMFAESAPKQLGIQSRKLLSNYASGTNQQDAIQLAEETLKKYGVNFDDNIMDQVIAESALRQVLPQKMFNTFQGDIEKGVGNVAGAAMRGDQIGVADGLLKKMLSRNPTPEEALKALEGLLR